MTTMMMVLRVMAALSADCGRTDGDDDWSDLDVAECAADRLEAAGVDRERAEDMGRVFAGVPASDECAQY